jgi:allantoin racemase
LSLDIWDDRVFSGNLPVLGLILAPVIPERRIKTMITKNIRIITPITTRGVRTLDDVKPLERPDLKITHTEIDMGPPSIESEYDEAMSLPGTIEKAIEAEQEGAHAVIIDCMGDPGLKSCREVVSIPVLGPAETSMHLAAMLGQKFSVVTVLDSVVPMLNNLAKIYSVSEKLASVRVVNIPVLEIEQDLGRLNKELSEAALKAVAEDGAHAIVLGCTGFFGCAEAIHQHLLKKLGISIPVIDPIPATVMVAASLVDVGLSHSKKTYATPPQKTMVGFSMPPFHKSAAE